MKNANSARGSVSPRASHAESGASPRKKVPLAAAPLTASTQHSRDAPRRVVLQRRFRAAAPVQASPSNRASTSVHSEMATTTSTASTGSLSNAAGDQSVAGEGGACLPTQTWMPVRAPARTVEAPLPCASGQWVLREGAAVIGSEEE